MCFGVQILGLEADDVDVFVGSTPPVYKLAPERLPRPKGKGSSSSRIIFSKVNSLLNFGFNNEKNDAVPFRKSNPLNATPPQEIRP